MSVNLKVLYKRMYPSADGAVGTIASTLGTGAHISFGSIDVLTRAEVEVSVAGSPMARYVTDPRLVRNTSYVVFNARTPSHPRAGYRPTPQNVRVLRFLRWEQPADAADETMADAMKWSLRSMKLELDRIACAQNLVAGYANHPVVGESHADFEEEFEDLITQQNAARTNIQNEHVAWMMANDRVGVFETVNKPHGLNQEIKINLYKDVDRPMDCKVVVLPLHCDQMNGFSATYGQEHTPGLHALFRSDVLGCLGFQQWRLRVGAFHKRTWAAGVVQRAWRKAMFDPTHDICRRRLLDEFEDMIAEQEPPPLPPAQKRSRFV